MDSLRTRSQEADQKADVTVGIPESNTHPSTSKQHLNFTTKLSFDLVLGGDSFGGDTFLVRFGDRNYVYSQWISYPKN